MRRTALVSVLLVLIAEAVWAQDTEAWPAEVEARVVALVSSELDVHSERLVIQWGLYRGEPVAPEAPVELLGSGMRGHWVVRVGLRSGRTASVRVRVGQMAERLVAARRIERGAALEPEDIALRQEMTWGAQDRTPADVEVGWVAQRLLRPGDALAAPALQPPMAVLSGRAVQLLWTRGAIGITAPGTAAGSSPIGGRVSVRTQTGEKLSGVVVAPGVVNVTSGDLK